MRKIGDRRFDAIRLLVFGIDFLGCMAENDIA
jgi:hypothetical protein